MKTVPLFLILLISITDNAVGQSRDCRAHPWTIPVRNHGVSPGPESPGWGGGQRDGQHADVLIQVLDQAAWVDSRAGIRIRDGSARSHWRR
jgi:hypothetical protein